MLQFSILAQNVCKCKARPFHGVCDFFAPVIRVCLTQGGMPKPCKIAQVKRETSGRRKSSRQHHTNLSLSPQSLKFGSNHYNNCKEVPSQLKGVSPVGAEGLTSMSALAVSSIFSLYVWTKSFKTYEWKKASRAKLFTKVCTDMTYLTFVLKFLYYALFKCLLYIHRMYSVIFRNVLTKA